ncbi:MAG: Rrf2 family transcriptional regulator [Spirochaetales bacterium]|nr:Rrf2 family transcriptional regulator [Spirochaetales bacterium]
MQFQKDVEYGLVTLTALGESEGLVSASQLSGSLSIPRSLEAKILQRLQKGGLIEAVRGQRGGYRLRRPLKAITVQEVIETLRGSERLTPCLRGEECARMDSCTIRRGVVSLQGLFDVLLSSVTLAQLAGRSEGLVEARVKAEA